MSSPLLTLDVAALTGAGPPLRGSFWPSEEQRALLVVALGAPDEAVATWESLQPTFVLDEHEPGSFDLMALIYRELSSAGHDDPTLRRMKGIYRREWVRANVLAEKTRAVAAVLADAGVRALFVDGAPLAERFYRERGTRPSWYLDVLVEPADAEAALGVLATAGWSPSQPGLGRPERRTLVSADRSVCVLRSAVSYDFVFAASPQRSLEPFWESAVRLDLDGAELLAPAPTETLLAVCAAGARAGSEGRVLWLLDAAMILRRSPIDAARLAALAASRGQTLRLRQVLAYLRTLPGVPVAAELTAALEAARVAPRERLAVALASGSVRRAGSLPELLARHLAATAGSSLPVSFARLPRALGAEWGTDSAWRLPYEAGRRAARRLSRRAPGGA